MVLVDLSTFTLLAIFLFLTQIRRYANKLFTDDKIQWLNSSETLRQQGIIHPYQPVILRRKFFYADANVEKQDPVQLNLLYEQCRDSITWIINLDLFSSLFW